MADYLYNTEFAQINNLSSTTAFPPCTLLIDKGESGKIAIIDKDGNEILLNNHIYLSSINNLGNNRKFIYIENGQFQTLSGARGTTSRPIYINSSNGFTACGATIGNNLLPIFMSGGTFYSCTARNNSTPGNFIPTVVNGVMSIGRTLNFYRNEYNSSAWSPSAYSSSPDAQIICSNQGGLELNAYTNLYGDLYINSFSDPLLDGENAGGNLTVEYTCSAYTLSAQSLQLGEDIELQETTFTHDGDASASTNTNVLELNVPLGIGQTIIGKENGSGMELYGHAGQPTPYIDFHYNSDNADSSARIICTGKNKLSINASSGLTLDGLLNAKSLIIGNTKIETDSNNVNSKITLRSNKGTDNNIIISPHSKDLRYFGNNVNCPDKGSGGLILLNSPGGGGVGIKTTFNTSDNTTQTISLGLWGGRINNNNHNTQYGLYRFKDDSSTRTIAKPILYASGEDVWRFRLYNGDNYMHQEIVNDNGKIICRWSNVQRYEWVLSNSNTVAYYENGVWGTYQKTS